MSILNKNETYVCNPLAKMLKSGNRATATAICGACQDQATPCGPKNYDIAARRTTSEPQRLGGPVSDSNISDIVVLGAKPVAK